MKSRPIIDFLCEASLTALLLLVAQDGALGDEPAHADRLARRVRQPVALTCADGGKTVLVANRRSGSLSIVDAVARRVVAEHEVGRGLADLARLPGNGLVLVVDQAANELVMLTYRDRAIRV